MVSTNESSFAAIERIAVKSRGIGRKRRGWTAAVVVVAASALTLTGITIPASAADRQHDRDRDNAFQQVNLVSDLPGVAQLLDPVVKNPWGIAFGPTTPLWVNNQFSGNPAVVQTKITLYRGATTDTDPIVKVPLEVTASSPTGMVFNPTQAFVVTQGATKAPARFLFNEATPDSTGAPVAEITGWQNPTTGTTVPKVSKNNAFWAGLALVPNSKSGPLLLAADFANGTIDVYNSKFKPVRPKDGAFVDPTVTAPPYNVTYLDGRVYVAYAVPFGAPGQPAISVFSRNGKFLKRLVTGGPLVGPWGLAIAPKHWGDFGGDLLVGNVDDGKINAFNPRSGHFEGTLKDSHGSPLVIPGLWGIEFGNGVIGNPNTLIFAAGIGEEVDAFGPEVYEHGLVGLIKPVKNGHDD